MKRNSILERPNTPQARADKEMRKADMDEAAITSSQAAAVQKARLAAAEATCRADMMENVRYGKGKPAYAPGPARTGEHGKGGPKGGELQQYRYAR